ncbi:hypothetical protein [Microtetraspora malaysiensis]|uniref:hypothetical protein n=1 Tax=Microtetraspora malaysiensis TaxID=161358 RepID=UPI003D8E85C1
MGHSRDDSLIIDTPWKDHPDDIDQTAGRQVIVVDGVKVVSTPMNHVADASLISVDGSAAQPTTAHVTVGAGTGTADTGAAGGPGSGHAPGAGSAGTGGAGAHGAGTQGSGAHAASGTSPGPHPDGPPGFVEPLEPTRQSVRHAGLAPGDPLGDYVGTPEDNVTEDPFATGGGDAVHGTPDSVDAAREKAKGGKT